MNILGISAFYHDSSCCLLQDGKLTAAVSEERFTRVKHDARLPVSAYKYCLDFGNLIPTDLDCIAYYESPLKKTARQLAYHSGTKSETNLLALNPGYPIRQIREKLGFNGPILHFDHHYSHAASAFFYSGFREAAIFTVDGVGEWATTSYGTGIENRLGLFETVDFPHSIGLLYATITAFLGFRVNNGEYKVMGLASYGKPAYLKQLQKLIEIKPRGQFRLNMDYFDFLDGNQMFSDNLAELLNLKPRLPEAAIENQHKDLAKSLQMLTETILLDKLAYLHAKTGMENIAMAGGVVLNAVANRRIRRESKFDQVFFQPAAGDAGGCLGAAALAHQKLTGVRHSNEVLTNLFLGPEFSDSSIKKTIAAAGITPIEYPSEEALIQELVDRLVDNQIIGWFQGRMEFGPRALGDRSILANPCDPAIQDRINQAVKKRESFRPFAPAVLFPHQKDYFDISHHTPFMIETCSVLSSKELPGITHVDGTARPQTVKEDENPRFAKLLAAFYEETGIPILVNTSFNQRGQPIVCTPVDALQCMGMSDLDAIVIGDHLIDRSQIPDNWELLFEDWYAATNENRDKLDNLYSFI